MDEITQPPCAGAAAPGPNAPHPQRRAKRRWMLSLIVLYLLSIGAAAFLVLRTQAPQSAKKGKGDDGKSLLSLADRTESVGWVHIRGPIYASESGRPWERGVEQWTRRIRLLSESKGVKALVLDINSPGGSVGAVQELYSQIQRVRKEKNIPVVCLFGDVAASGGYYIAAACDKIVAHPGTLTGSIGVIFSVSNLEGLFQKIGYKVDPIKSGKHKDIGSPARPMTAEERQLLQALIDDAYNQFLTAIINGRSLKLEDVKPLADGRIFSGRQALDAKLVDKLGDSTDALELAGELGGIKGRPRVKRDAERFSDILELLDARFPGILGAASPLFDRLSPRVHAGLEYRWPGFAGL